MKEFLKGLEKSFYMVAGYLAISGLLVFSWIYANDPALILETPRDAVFYFAIAGVLFSIWNMYKREKLETHVLDELPGEPDE